MDTTPPTTPTSAPLSDEERAELSWMRSENKLLRVERDILMQVATGYANDAIRDAMVHHSTCRYR